MLSYIPFIQIIELTATIAAFIYLRGDKENPWRWFKWFLLFVFLIESSGYLYRMMKMLEQQKPVNNHIFYKINLPVEAIFHSWILFRFTKAYKKITAYYLSGVILFFCLFLTDLIWLSSGKYVVVSDLYETLFLLIGCCLFYYYFLKQEHHIEVMRFAPFWIVTGMFFYHFVAFCTTVFFDYLAFVNEKEIGIPLRRYVFIVLLTIFYGSWIYAFICRRKSLS